MTLLQEPLGSATDTHPNTSPTTGADLDDRPAIRLGEAARLADGPPPPDLGDDEGTDEEAPLGVAPVNPTVAALAALLSAAAVGWMLGGIFAGFTPRLVGVAGALIGGGFVALSFRTRTPAVLQLAATPVALVLGILLAANAGASGVNPFVLVQQAVSAGGLSQPPVPFDPGWRLLLIVVSCALAVAAATGAVSLNRAKLAALLPAPVVLVGVLVQPPGAELVSAAVSLALVVAALAVAYGAELARDSDTGLQFEVQRLAKAGALLAGIVAVLIALSQLGFLFPGQQSSAIIPPKKPQTPPAAGSGLLFTVRTPTAVPLRTGVLDVYADDAWLTPPYDIKRYVPVHSGAPLPAFSPVREAKSAITSVTVPVTTTTATITIADLGESRQVPDLAGSVSVTDAPKGLAYDPRSQTFQTAGRPSHGLTYTVTAAATPTTAQLNAARAGGPNTAGFLAVPPMPASVRTLIASIPSGLSDFERLQFVRNDFFKHAVAAGPGVPVDVSPARVAQILAGQPASPYEITAAEVLLARWVGVPARIGYGYYDQTPTSPGVFAVHPDDGATWLEVSFTHDIGWVPILGHPAQATSSLDKATKKSTPNVLPSGDIIAQLYIPLQQTTVTQLYLDVQYWLLHAVVPIVAPVLFVWLLLPGLVKLARRRRRARWARRIGPRSRIVVAYAEFRDRAIDLNAGHPSLTPLEFLDVTQVDDEHAELAWLVTRALWGDLRRDLRDVDVERAEELSRRLTRRASGGQPLLQRAVAFSSRVSLRDPWTAEIPNLWPSATTRGRLPRAVRAVGRGLDPRGRRPRLRLRFRLRPGAAAVLLLVVGLFTLSGCGSAHADAPVTAPLPAVPASVDGFKFQPQDATAAFAPYRAQALVASVGLYAVRQSGVAVGTLQTAVFKPRLAASSLTVREKVISTLGGDPAVEVVGGQRIYATTVNQLRLLVHFAADGRSYEVFAASSAVADPDGVFAALLTAQQGPSSGPSVQVVTVRPSDARREL